LFSENGGGEPKGSGYGIGDPHLATFFGVHYDFQASGDFLLVRADPDFIVQTRHKPIGGNVSVNTAVATKMGDTRVAICFRRRLEINGTPADLSDGKAMAFGDVLVSRKGNTYEILGPGAAMVRADVGDVINVYVSLGGINRETARGLLGAASGHPLDLAMPDGNVLPNPPSYAAFIRYADSWRVKPEESLLCHSREVPPGMPPKPISAADLDPRERERVQAICMAAGVRVGPLLDDCMLDVSVLGGANWVVGPFLSAPAPIKQITPTFP
jgi:hypothetical protein